MSALGPDWDVLNVTVNALASNTEITYDRAVKSFVYWSRGSKAFRVKRRSADTETITFGEGERFDSKILLSDANFAGSSLGFVTIVDGSADVIEGVVTF